MIYFVHAKELALTKVGYAKAPYRRLTNLQIGCPVELTLVRLLTGEVTDEKRLHGLLAQHRKRGEWFSLTDEQIRSDFGLADVPLRPEYKYAPRIVTDGPAPELHQLVEDALVRHRLPPTSFGMKVFGDPGFVADLRRGREMRRASRLKVITFIAELDNGASA